MKKYINGLFYERQTNPHQYLSVYPKFACRSIMLLSGMSRKCFRQRFNLGYPFAIRFVIVCGKYHYIQTLFPLNIPFLLFQRFQFPCFGMPFRNAVQFYITQWEIIFFHTIVRYFLLSLYIKLSLWSTLIPFLQFKYSRTSTEQDSFIFIRLVYVTL